VNAVAELTVPEKILMAAQQLEERGQSPFSAEALIVASWQKFPKTFGLKGYADQYPDSNKVLSCIMGERGLTRRGWLCKMGQKLYSLTREGKAVVLRLQNGGEPPSVGSLPAIRISRDQEKILLGLFSSSAVQKFEEGLKEELTFADASRYWGTEELRGDALTTRLARIRATLADVERSLANSTAELTNGRSVSKDDIVLLTAVHEYLEDRFARHLNLLRTRVVRV
jgi:hypothetical protein